MTIEEIDWEPDDDNPARTNQDIEHPGKLWVSEGAEIFLTLSQDRPWTRVHKKWK